MKKYVLMSIKPEYADKIKSGVKTIELRRILPKVSSGDILVIYETSPVQAITAYCHIQSLISGEPETLWKAYGKFFCINKASYDAYFSGKDNAGGIVLEKAVILDAPMSISGIMTKPHVPQSFCYLSENEFQRLLVKYSLE